VARVLIGEKTYGSTRKGRLCMMEVETGVIQYEPRHTKDCQKLPEAEREGWKGLSLRAWKNEPAGTLTLNIWPSEFEEKKSPFLKPSSLWLFVL
jgi:hypothetical protein